MGRDQICPQTGSSRNERNPQGPGKEAETHLVVGIVFILDLSVFNCLSKPNTRGSKATIAGVGHFNPLDTSCTNEEIKGLAVGMTDDMEIFDPLSNDLVNDPHGIAIDREPSESDLRLVLDISLHGLFWRHQFVLDLWIFHRLCCHTKYNEKIHMTFYET
jgi:hypothetical protein